MIRNDRLHILSYILVSILSVSGAFLISLHFLQHAKAQTEEQPTPQSADSTDDDSADQSEAPMETPKEAPQVPSPATAVDQAGGGQDAAEDEEAEPPPPANASEPRAQGMPLPPPPPQNSPSAMPNAMPNAMPSVPSASPQIVANAAQAAGINELEGFLEPFIYDIVNRRDPFQPYADFTPAAQPTEQAPSKALTPAQRWDLDQLKLIGIMWDIKDPKAMFLDPEEDVMILGRDESIGNKNGYVATIREGEVVVVEAIRKRGDIIYRTRVLRIER